MTARVCRVALLAVAAGLAGLGLLLPDAHADSVALVGFGASSTANAATATYYDPLVPVPATPTAELDADHTQAALQSGPVGRALASSAWPGDLIAGIGPALGLLLPVNPGLGAYPVRAQAAYPQGQSSQVNNTIPANQMAASANSHSIDAAAHSAGGTLPVAIVQGALASAVHLSSTVTAVVTAGTASASDVNILAGLIHIASVTSNASITTDGTKPVLTGATGVVGMTVGGVPISIDAGGPHIGTGGTPAGGPTASAESVLRQAGVTMSVAQPVDLVSRSRAERVVGGLTIQVKASTLDKYVKALPAPVGQQLSAVLNLQQDLFLGFGSIDVNVGTVTAAASAPVPVTLPAAPAPPAAVVVSPVDTGPAPAAPAPAAAQPTTVAAPPAAAPTTQVLVPDLGTRLARAYRGLGPWSIVLAALLALAVVAPFWRLTTDALDAAASPDACPLDARSQSHE